ncbi:MAG: hypothetical protein ABFD08_18665 [Syntrophomonas sp.]
MIINNFNPQGKQFAFYFTIDTCYEKETGVCALDAFKNDMNYSFREYCNKRNFNSCIRAYLSLKENHIVYEYERYIQLVENKCGHFEFIDGQHRTCIALKMNMLLNVEIHKNDSDDRCEICDANR